MAGYPIALLLAVIALLGPLTIPLGLTLTVLALLIVAALVDFALRFAEHPKVMFGVLLKVLGGNTVVAQMGITRQLIVFLDDLLRRATHFALGAGTVEHAVDDVAALRLAVAVILRPGP